MYEYLIIRHKHFEHTSSEEKWLNTLGKGKWELVSIHQYLSENRYTFKRKKPIE